MRNPLLPAIFILLLALPLFAEYSESINIIVVDQLGRPVPGATVWAEYWIRYELKANTSKLITGANGTVTIKYFNYDPSGSRTKNDYTVYVKFGSSSVSQSFSHSSTPVIREDPYPMHVTSYALYLKLFDQTRQPHPNTTVQFENSAATTDSSGNAFLQVGGGKINITLRKLGFESTRSFTMVNDTNEQVIWPIYSPRVKVIDDRGAPLNATVRAGDMEIQTDVNGTAQFPKTPLASAEVAATYGRREKKLVADFSVQESLTIVIDTHKPVFRSLPTVELVDGLGRVTIEVADEGAYASGFDENSHFVVRYRVKGRERDASMYTLKRGTYQADIPVQPPNTYVSFSITISDKEGNSNKALGEYIVPSGTKPKPPGGGTGQNGTGTTPDGDKIFGFDPTTVYAGVGAAIIAMVAGYFLILKKKDEY
jgi:hypothetical protein